MVGTIPPSLDQGRALADSLLWVGRGLADRGGVHLGGAVRDRQVHHVGQAVLVRDPRCFADRHSARPWLSLAAMLSVIIDVRLAVLFTYQSRDLYNAGVVIGSGLATGDDARGSRHPRLLGVARGLLDPGGHPGDAGDGRPVHHAAVHAGVARVADRPAHRRLARRAGLLPGRFIDEGIDNPDQRIQSDIDVFTALSVRKAQHTAPNQRRHTAVRGDQVHRVGGLVTAGILWTLSGELSLFGWTIPKAMFWVVFGYVAVASLIVRTRPSPHPPELQQRSSTPPSAMRWCGCDAAESWRSTR